MIERSRHTPDTPAPPAAAPVNEAQPTRKYTTYLAEVQRALTGRLSTREQHRREQELALLQRARFVKLNGITHHYQDVGPRDGVPLVLVHGWDCSAFWWHHIVDPLADAGYRIILYDLKGHGLSDNDPGCNYTVASFTNDLRALGEALGLPQHHIAAFSFGAVVALNYAATSPDRVASLAFFNFGLLSYKPAEVAMLPRLMDLVYNRMLRPIEKLGLWQIPFVYARLVLAQNTPDPNDILLGTLSLRHCDPEAVRVSAQQLADREVQEAIPQQAAELEQRILLVAGKNDPIMLPARGRKLIELSKNGTFLEVPRCGHLILFELPDLVVQILCEHLQGGPCS